MKLIVDLIFVLALLCGLTWFAIPSAWFIKDISLTITGRDVVFVRETPFGEVRASWWSDITLANGFECNSQIWREAVYQEAPGNTVSYQLGDWALPCIEIGPPYYLRTKRRVWLFDAIPLRPSTSYVEVRAPDPTVIVVPIAPEG